MDFKEKTLYKDKLSDIVTLQIHVMESQGSLNL